MAEKKIAGRLFRVQPPLATVAIKLQFRVMNLLGGSVGELPGAIDALQTASRTKDEGAVSAANGKVIGVIIGILGRMKPDEGAALISDLVAMAEIKAANGAYEPADLDTEFSSDPSGLYELVGFVLKEALGPFISGLMGSMSGPKRASL